MDKTERSKTSKGIVGNTKNTEEEQIEWIAKEAHARAEAAGDKDWERGLKQMLRIAKEREIKQNVITKGKHEGALDRIEVVTHE